MKKKKLCDTDFLYLSTRLRAAEGNLITAEKLNRMLEAKSFEEAFTTACELYGNSSAEYAPEDYEKMLAAELAKAYAFACELIDGTVDVDSKPFELLAPFRYVYDCQNLKAAIKCAALEKDALPMLSPNGSVTPEAVKAAVADGDYAAFSVNLAAAAPEAVEKLSATGDPQEVDLTLDKAAFADMHEAASASGLMYLSELMRVKTDCTNISTALRCIRQGKPKLYMQKLYLPGGMLDEDFFAAHYDETPAKLLDALAYTAYSGLVSNSAENTPNAAQIEKRCDELYAEKAYAVKYLPFGAELVVCYIVQKEYEIKNVRIVLAGIACGLAPDQIKARLRGIAS